MTKSNSPRNRHQMRAEKVLRHKLGLARLTHIRGDAARGVAVAMKEHGLIVSRVLRVIDDYTAVAVMVALDDVRALLLATLAGDRGHLDDGINQANARLAEIARSEFEKRTRISREDGA